VIAQDGIEVVMFARDEGFAERRFRSLSDSLELPALGISLPLAEIYRGRMLRVPRFIPIEMAMKARVTVTLKSGILDPQGKAIEGALRSLGVDGVASVRQGKVFDIEVEGTDRAGSEAALKAAAEKLLANTVIENYCIEVTG
jgi:phosphoribosylformylglycinamidine synthase subunit PurS